MGSCRKVFRLLLISGLSGWSFNEKIVQGRRKRKAPKGTSESPWSLHIKSLWKNHFINPPEEQRQIITESKNGEITITEI
jgi:hypothetical protein